MKRQKMLSISYICKEYTEQTTLFILFFYNKNANVYVKTFYFLVFILQEHQDIWIETG